MGHASWSGAVHERGAVFHDPCYAIESAARISAISCLEIVFAAIWGISFLGEIPDVWVVSGGLLIVMGTLIIGHDGQSEKASQES